MRVQIANHFITRKELDSAYFCYGEINEPKVVAKIMLSSFNCNKIVHLLNQAYLSKWLKMYPR